MDAPPPGEDTRPFVRIAALMQAAGMRSYGSGERHGAGIPAAVGPQRDHVSGCAQRPQCPRAVRSRDRHPHSVAIGGGRRSSAAVRRSIVEAGLALFPDWFVARHLQRQLSDTQRVALEDAFKRIVAASLAQPQVFVHRDYMPRNLIVSKPNPGVLDFQDAVIGPIAYDVVSLFRDAFISWDDERVREWARLYFDRARTAATGPRTLRRILAGLRMDRVQRHLKVLGIFAHKVPRRQAALS